jgi:AcrR family transcriptional regulator
MRPAGIATLIRIIEAGIEVFSEDGFSGAGTLEIARRAGVAESTIFRKFETKEDLFRECLRTALRNSLDPAQFQAMVFKDAGKAGFPDAVLAAMRRWYARLSPPAARLILYTSLSRSPEWRALGSERISRIIGILTESIEQHAQHSPSGRLDAETAATSLIATLLYLKSVRARERDPRLVDTVVRQWLHGILPG